MKLNRILLAMAVAMPAAMSANAGVTLSPLLLGYHYMGEAHDEQRKAVREATGNALSLTQNSGLYTGVGAGIELSPSISLEFEYGVSRTNARKSKADFKTLTGKFDGDQRNMTANLLVTSDLLTQNYSSPFKPYLLVGAGVADYEISSQLTGQKVYNSDDTIGNLGLGAFYRINDSLSLRGEGRATYNFDGKWVEGLALAGLQVVLGGHLKPTYPAPPPVEVETPVDSDGDGVIDSLDKCPGTPRGVVVDATGCPKSLEKAVTIPLNVYFDTNKSYIKPQYQGEISKVATFMKQYPAATTVIEGHTDSRGSAKYNQRLSQRRANAVKQALAAKHGINPARLTAVGYGEARPVASNKTAAGRAENRRVHAVVSGKKTVVVKK